MDTCRASRGSGDQLRDPVRVDPHALVRIRLRLRRLAAQEHGPSLVAGGLRPPCGGQLAGQVEELAVEHLVPRAAAVAEQRRARALRHALREERAEPRPRFLGPAGTKPRVQACRSVTHARLRADGAMPEPAAIMMSGVLGSSGSRKVEGCTAQVTALPAGRAFSQWVQSPLCRRPWSGKSSCTVMQSRSRSGSTRLELAQVYVRGCRRTSQLRASVLWPRKNRLRPRHLRDKVHEVVQVHAYGHPSTLLRQKGMKRARLSKQLWGRKDL